MSTRSNTPSAFSSKFDAVVTPVRRPPPSSLRLVGGPLPARSRPKHTLPSLPRPTFHPKVTPMPGPKPRRRVHSTEDIFLFIHGLNTPTTIHGPTILVGPSSRDGEDSGASSPVSETSDNSTPPSPSGSDHARRNSLSQFPFENSTVLAIPKPAAINVVGMR